jgi:hypothetical protein
MENKREEGWDTGGEEVQGANKGLRGVGGGGGGPDGGYGVYLGVWFGNE